MLRGIRGAITVEYDIESEVISATEELLEKILEVNPSLHSDDIASILFTVTEDIRSVHPAKAARKLGWTTVPLLCSTEIPVSNSLTKCIRALIHWNTDLRQNEIKHVYLREAIILRPDLIKTI